MKQTKAPEATKSIISRATSNVIKFIHSLVVVSVLLFAFLPLALHLTAQVKINEVLTGSMEPTMMVGDRVVTRPVLPGEIEPGDIVEVDREVSVTHRVIARDADGTLTTWGDNNPTADEFKPTEDDLLSVVVLIIPQPLAGVLSDFTTTHEWRLKFGHVVTGNGGSWDDLQEGMPWGSIGSVAAMIFTSILSLLLKLGEFVQRRRANKLESRVSDSSARSQALSPGSNTTPRIAD